MGIDLFDRIEFVFQHESLRRILNEYEGFGPLPKNMVGWSSKFRKRQLPDIEIYIDALVIGAMTGIREKGLKPSEGLLSAVITEMISAVLIHELVHDLTDDADEGRVCAATEAMTRPVMAMGWKLIPCPNKNQSLVTFSECLACDDEHKNEECPILRIRQAAYPRTDRANEYHISELEFLRKSYYTRLFEHSKSWTDYGPFFFGNAVGAYIASLFGIKKAEVDLRVDFGEYFITGHVDVLDDEDGRIIEIKCYQNLTYIIKGGKPSPMHEFQARSYLTLAKMQRPDLLRNLKHIYVFYVGKNGLPWWKDYKVPKEDVDLKTPADTLHNALKMHIPPSKTCPSWLCKLCEYRDHCEEDGARGM